MQHIFDISLCMRANLEALQSAWSLEIVLVTKQWAAMQVPVMCFHHDFKIYNEPEAYKPERWMEGTPEYAADKHVQGKWMPFGEGTRVCVGQRLALMEARVALTHVFRRSGLHPWFKDLLRSAMISTMAVSATTQWLAEKVSLVRACPMWLSLSQVKLPSSSNLQILP